MLRQEKPNWVASLHAPNPKEVTYWIDLSSNPDGQIVRCYTKGKWTKLNEEQNDVQDMDVIGLKNAVAELKTSKLDVTVHNSFVEESNKAHNSIILSKADKATTLSGYGITNAYTKTETNNAISTKVAEIIDAAPEALNTLNELAAALGNDPNFAATITAQIGTKANSSDVYTTTQTDQAISSAITSKVTSTDINTIKVVSELPTIQETGVLYIKIS